MLDKELITDGDSINRLIFHPQHPRIDWASIFQFNKRNGSRRESIVWRKYAPTIADVHAIGCNTQAEMNARRTEEGRPANVEYQGAIEALVSAIRTIRSEHGHCFDVMHEPGDGQGQHHAEISMEVAIEQPLHSNDRQELRQRLFRLFGGLVAHRCAAAE